MNIYLASFWNVGRLYRRTTRDSPIQGSTILTPSDWILQQHTSSLPCVSCFPNSLTPAWINLMPFAAFRVRMSRTSVEV